MTLRRWWRTRGHDVRDINCIHWDQARSAAATCPPCLASGGYVAQRHREIDLERPLIHPTSDPSG